jgi:hypothetical protein
MVTFAFLFSSLPVNNFDYQMLYILFYKWIQEIGTRDDVCADWKMLAGIYYIYIWAQQDIGLLGFSNSIHIQSLMFDLCIDDVIVVIQFYFCSNGNVSATMHVLNWNRNKCVKSEDYGPAVAVGSVWTHWDNDYKH